MILQRYIKKTIYARTHDFFDKKRKQGAVARAFNHDNRYWASARWENVTFVEFKMYGA